MQLNLDQRRRVLAIALGILVMLFHFFWLVSNQPALAELQSRLDRLFYDYRFNRTLAENIQPDPRIVIVDIDERSLAEQGRWPWPRKDFAKLLNKMHELGVAVTALDMLFIDKEHNPISHVQDAAEDLDIDFLNSLQSEKIKEYLNGDKWLAESLAKHEIIVGYIFDDRDTELRGGLPIPANVQRQPGMADYGKISQATGIFSNQSVISEAAQYTGFFSNREDPDGVMRSYSLLYGYKDQLYSSLALEAVRVFQVQNNLYLIPSEKQQLLAGVAVGNQFIPTDNSGRALIPFIGKSYSFDYISATDILEGRVDSDELEGRIAFVGSTAKTLFDFRSTPVQPNYPGLEIHATIANGILTGGFKEAPAWEVGAAVFSVVVLGLFLSIALPFMNAVVSLILSCVVVLSQVVFNIWLWDVHNLALNIAVPLSCTLMIISVNIAFGFLYENKAKRQVSDMFGQYVPSALVRQMRTSPESALSFDGERRDMTVLFADIRSFTTISEGMEPAELKDMLNRYFTPMTRIIFENKGTIDKYIGDMVMAFWGAPIDDADHAVNALKAALAMQVETARLKPEFDKLGYPEIAIGIGLNSGDMNVGNMGSEYRRSYTVLGDNVNLGSRVESLTKFYGLKLMVAENTFSATKSFFEYRLIDRVLVKGKEEAVELYEPICEIGQLSEDETRELDDYRKALALYYARHWKQANAMFTGLSIEYPHREIYKIYRQRTAPNVEVPEEGWDGVFRHTSK